MAAVENDVFDGDFEDFTEEGDEGHGLSSLMQEALAELDKARACVLRGQPKAAVQHAGDAINMIAEDADIHAYATY